MAQVLDGADAPILITEAALQRVERKAKILPHIFSEVRKPEEGGNSFLVYPPAPIVEPSDFTPPLSYGDADCVNTPTSEINRTPFPVTFNRHKIHRIAYTLFESRVARGGFKRAWDWAFGGYVDGMIRSIEKDIASKYVDAANFVGSGTENLTDTVVRDGITVLANYDVDPSVEDTTIVVSPKTYWRDLLDEDRYARYDAAGDNAALAKGRFADAYDITWERSSAIVGSNGSGGQVVHNLLFKDMALGIAFNQFDKVSDHVGAAGQNVEESTIASNGVNIRTQKYYDPKCKYVVIEMDVAWVAYVLVPEWLVDVRSKAT